jgi:hypothetical protein
MGDKMATAKFDQWFVNNCSWSFINSAYKQLKCRDMTHNCDRAHEAYFYQHIPDVNTTICCNEHLQRLISLNIFLCSKKIYFKHFSTQNGLNDDF